MKRAGKYGLVALLLAAVIGAVGWASARLLFTAEGVRWVMNTISSQTPVVISAQQVDGRLFDRLRLQGIRIVLAPFEVKIESLDCRWQPLLLLSDRFAIQELTLAGVQVQDDTPAGTPPDLVWPRLSGATGLSGGTIERLTVNGLTYRLRDGQPVHLNAISTRVSMKKGLLSLSDLAAAAPDGRIAGSITAGFDRPTLEMALTATLTKPVAGMDLFSIEGRFLPGQEGEQLAGMFTVAGSTGNVKSLAFAGEAGMTRNAFNLRQLHLTRPGRRGSIKGTGSVTLTEHAPLFALQLAAEGVDLSSDGKRATDLSGTLTLSGTRALYEGAFNLANRGKGWQAAQLSGSYRGDGGVVKLAPLNGSLLSGSVQGSLDLEWGRELSLTGTISGRNLNPEAVSPDWTGMVNFDLAGGIAWPDQAKPRGHLNGRLLSSRLHGQELTGEILADFARGDMAIGRMVLQGKGFDLGAEGSLGKRLAFHAQVSDLGRLIPRAAGEIRTDGWMRWRDGHLEGAVTGRGRNIAAAGLSIADAKLTARLEEGKGSPLHVDLELYKASYGRFQVDSVIAGADGSALRHTARLVLNSKHAEARISLAGAYDRGVWRGEIARFSGKDGIGAWDLIAPARLSVAAGGVTLDPLVLKGGQTEQVEIAGKLNADPLGGSFRAVFSGLNLARANPWLPRDLHFDGRLAGRAGAEILPGKRLDLTGQISLTQGKIRRRDGDGTLEADLQTADLSWRWQGVLPGSAAKLEAGRLVVAGRGVLSGNWSAGGRKIAVESGSLTLNGDERGLRAGIAFTLTGGGMVNGAFSSVEPASLAAPETGDVTAGWTGVNPALFRSWLPDGVSLGGTLAGGIAGRILPGKELDLSGKISLAQGKLLWQGESAALNADIRTAELSWGWRGAMPATTAQIGKGRLVMTGLIGASGLITVGGRTIGVEQGSLSLDGNERGMNARIDLKLAGGGTLNGRLSSSRPAALAVPAEAETVLAWAGIDLALLKPWLPRAIGLEGRLAGRLTGNFLPGEKLAMNGETALSGGKLRWSRPEGEIHLNLRNASASWRWQGEALRGSYALNLTEQGEIKGNFNLPIPAHLPVAVDKKGAITASLTGQVLEKGILASLFPGFIRESRGEIDTDLRIGGTWEAPIFTGSLTLAKAGAYLPTAGIHLSDIRIAVHLEKELLRIDSFRAVSGAGHMEGTALVRLKGWQVAGFSGSINGERFQLLYFPELQILGSPRLTFEGTPEKLAVRGEMHLPELFIFGPPAKAVVLASRDVILEEAPKQAKRSSPPALDVQVRLSLGEKVFIKLEGIDAQLDGGVDLVFKSLDRITSKGEIKVVKGRYSAYGVNLEIVRGRLFYAGGPIDQPTLDILALRTVGDVRAGISVGGILRRPLIKLYSEPSMPDVDILGYIVFGRPLGSRSDSEQASMMIQAAGVLLSRGQSVVLQEQIKSRLGLSTLEIQSGGTAAAGRLGYKEIARSPTGITPATQPDGVSQTMLTVGKYLTPQLYFSYGRSLFTGGNLFRLRYDLFKRWQIETQTGSESGIDLYYKVEFD